MHTYSKEEIADLLEKRLPDWEYADGSLLRTYNTQGWKSALVLASTIGHLAEVAWHHPELRLHYSKVEVHLHTHSENGITELDFELAEKIEQVIGWVPPEGSSLSGTPDDPKYRHLKL
ncbi:MAG: 4a-hydroxytetrahydrobiopterin dehydratase [Gammaproteobacteria bacterium]|nr:4a-hydroxytetrahydrobiopterin dehydratase [Gammaproteobacteria bacterium]